MKRITLRRFLGHDDPPWYESPFVWVPCVGVLIFVCALVGCGFLAGYGL